VPRIKTFANTEQSS